MRNEAGRGLAWRLDPRTKMIVLVTACASSCIYRDVYWGSVLFACALVLACSVGCRRLAGRFLAGYAVVLALVGLTTLLSPDVGARVALIVQSLRAAFPALLLAAVLMQTTKIGDLVAALFSLRMPKALVIPLAVGIRFFPTLAEECRFVSDAAKLQGLELSFSTLAAAPAAVFEARFVPVMLRSTKIAEELAAASVARGIERPGARTSFNPLAFGSPDLAVAISFCGACALILALRFAFSGGGL